MKATVYDLTVILLLQESRTRICKILPPQKKTIKHVPSFKLNLYLHAMQVRNPLKY